ncbi:hypothetical protein BGX38DRAFT_425459 [Terfezia claveryi]|nr:hypothetical protein BGX38DRAFT_425459 [Terfezia claveryi]
MPQTRSQTGIGAAAHQKKSDAARPTTAPSPQAGDSTTESSTKQLSTRKRPYIADYSETIAEFKDCIEKLHRRIDAQPSAGHGGSHSPKLGTSDLMQLFAHILETMQHREISDLEDSNCRLRKEFAASKEEFLSRGINLGIPAPVGLRDWEKILVEF